MAELLTCSIDSLHAHSLTIFNPKAYGGEPRVSAKIGFGAGGKPVGEVSVEGLEENDEVSKAAMALVKAVEEAYAPTVGTVVSDLKPTGGEPPAGIIDF